MKLNACKESCVIITGGYAIISPEISSIKRAARDVAEIRELDHGWNPIWN